MMTTARVLVCCFGLVQLTDGFTGAAPDLGALEIGQVQPHYGPR